MLSHLGNYDLLEELGSGGAGKVYRARHRLLEREVALKVVHARVKVDDERRQRLLREARAAAKLEHSDIARLYEVFEVDGSPCFAFELVRGETLRARLEREGCLAPTEALALVERLALAAHFAHEQGIVHRDLKPENVLLDPAGAPHIIDFGVAKDLTDPRANISRSGDLVGTPAYLAPEQAEGRVDELDARVDVWALGVILHELLSGAPPFRSENLFALLQEIAAATPAAPRRPDGGGTGAAGEVARSALRKDPAERPTALALALACRRAREGASARWALLTATVLAVAVAVGVGLARPARSDPLAGVAATPSATVAVPPSAAVAVPPSAAVAVPPSAAVVAPVAPRPGPRVRALALALERDEARLLVGDDEGGLALVDAASGAALRTWPGHGAVTTLASAPEGGLAAIGRVDGAVELVEAHALAPRPLAPGAGAAVQALAWSPDGQQLAVAFAGRLPAVWALSAREARSFPAQAIGVRAITFLAAQRRLLTGDEDGTIKAWTVGRAIVLDGSTRLDVGAVLALDCESDGGRVLVAGARGLAVFRSKERSLLWSRADDQGAVVATGWLVGGRAGVVVDCRASGRVWLRNGQEGDVRHALDLPAAPACAVASEDGRRMWVGTDDGVACWDLTVDARLWPR